MEDSGIDSGDHNGDPTFKPTVCSKNVYHYFSTEFFVLISNCFFFNIISNSFQLKYQSAANICNFL